MSKIIIFNKDENLSEYYQSAIHGLYDLETMISQHENYSPELLKDKDVAIINYDHKTSEILTKYCLETTPRIPCIITGTEEQIFYAKKKFKTHGLLEYFTHHDSIELLWQKINRFTELHKRTQKKKEFCRVNLSFFFSTKTVFCDIYLKVNEQKYIKIFNRYDEIDFKDIKKYDHKNIRYLYVRERDFSLIMKKLVEELQPIMTSSSQALTIRNKSLSSVFSIQLQETVSESINKLGLNGEAIEMTNLAINSTLELIHSNDEIFNILHDVIKGKNYISEHSYLLTYISCSLLKESPYSDPDNNLCLSIAAFFHDISLDTEAKAKVQSTDDYQFKILGIKEQEEVLEHPEAAAEIVSKISGIPSEVQTILLQHHENYEGTGFPRGLDYKRIHILSAIFNVAHELALYFFESGQDPQNVRDIIDDLSQKYKKGNYKVAIQAAKKVFRLKTSASSNLKKVS